jgi:hypothetical protein
MVTIELSALVDERVGVSRRIPWLLVPWPLRFPTHRRAGPPPPPTTTTLPISLGAVQGVAVQSADVVCARCAELEPEQAAKAHLLASVDTGAVVCVPVVRPMLPPPCCVFSTEQWCCNVSCASPVSPPSLPRPAATAGAPTPAAASLYTPPVPHPYAAPVKTATPGPASGAGTAAGGGAGAGAAPGGYPVKPDLVPAYLQSRSGASADPVPLTAQYMAVLKLRFGLQMKQRKTNCCHGEEGWDRDGRHAAVGCTHLLGVVAGLVARPVFVDTPLRPGLGLGLG